MPSEIERNLLSSIQTVKPLINRTIEAYGLTNIADDEVSDSRIHVISRSLIAFLEATKLHWYCDVSNIQDIKSPNLFIPVTPRGHLDVTSPYDICELSSKQVSRI